MAVTCPYCRRSIQFKGVKPGRFAPKCPQCGRAFRLTVSADDPPKMTVVALKEGAPAPATAKQDAARPAKPPSKPAVKKATAPEAPSDQPSDVTGAWQKPTEDVGGATGGWETGEPTEVVASRGPAPADPAVDEPAQETTGDQTGAWSASEAEVTGAWSESGGDAGDPKAAAAATAASPQPAAPPRTAPKSDKAVAAASKKINMPEKLGGYQIKKELGRGGMGSVYLARQVSLDRDVAIKVMNPEWASNPTFVARFTREAYAAAQLVHHNVVQIHDIGFEKDIHFFSMEFVKGNSLGDLLKKDGKLTAQAAVGYVLQAARGLKFAHDQGMIHRDIKPDNLMLNDQGIVKVADLGLVKTPAAVEEESKPTAETTADQPVTGITRVGVTVGTPAYMSPEQARSASTVDQRADIYSLGCSLYALITGKQPFAGKTVMEILTKHASEPVVPPEVVVKRVPKSLSTIIVRMMAKEPKDRYADLGEVIKALEEWLGVETSGPVTPKEEHADKLEACVGTFNSSALASFKPWIVLGFVAISMIMVVASALAGMPALAGGFLGLPLLALVAYFVISGLARRTFVFGKVRAYVLGCGWKDWLVWSLGFILAMLVLYVFNLLFIWLAFCVVAVAFGFAMHLLVDGRIARHQQGPVKDAELMLRNMRLQAMDEDAIRQFVCKFSGEHWESFYEALFGYEAKIKARDNWGRGADERQRPRYGAWRDWLVGWIDSRMKARREARERKLLRQIELKNLQAMGLSAAEANRQADQTADALVQRAAEFREAGGAATLKSLVTDADKSEVDRTARPGSRTPTSLLFVFGPRARFILGALLLAACVLWIRQNHLKPAESLKSMANEAVEDKDAQKQLGVLQRVFDPKTEPLAIPGVPEAVCIVFFNSYHPGLAGVILILSALFSGVRPFLFVFPGLLVLLGWQLLPIPELATMTGSIATLTAGLVLGLAGLWTAMRWRSVQ